MSLKRAKMLENKFKRLIFVKKYLNMTATAIQQVTIEDVKQAILVLFKENSAELKSFLDDLSSKITDTPSPKKKKTKAKKPKESTFTVVEGPRIPYSEMPFWKANPHLHAQALAFREKNDRPAHSNVATAFKKAQEAFSDLDVTDEEWLLQIQD
jgi:hypothetical protein